MELERVKLIFDVFIYISIAVIAVSLMLFILRLAGVQRLKNVKVHAPMTFGVLTLILALLGSNAAVVEARERILFAGKWVGHNMTGEDLNYPFKYIFGAGIAILCLVAAAELISRCIKYLRKRVKRK